VQNSIKRIIDIGARSERLMINNKSRDSKTLQQKAAGPILVYMQTWLRYFIVGHLSDAAIKVGVVWTTGFY
jgi:hypothetical protein